MNTDIQDTTFKKAMYMHKYHVYNCMKRRLYTGYKREVADSMLKVYFNVVSL